MDLSIVVPIYNESLNIDLLYKRLKDVLEKLSLSYEILFVNDGSSDNSLEMIKEISLNDSSVKYISFNRNFGHQIAVSAGMDYASGDAVAIIDADLQDPPELLKEMHEKLRQGNIVVYAQRKSRKDKNIFKKFMYKLFYRLLRKITTTPIPLDTGDFRIMDRKMVEMMKQMPEQPKFLRGQIAWVGGKQDYVLYDRDERNAGEPGYTYGKLFKLAMDGITSFSDLPLKFASLSGSFILIITLPFILYTLYSKLFSDSSPPGWASLMLTVIFMGGIQLLTIGIIGEYIGRIYLNIRQRPLYIVAEANTQKGS